LFRPGSGLEGGEKMHKAQEMRLVGGVFGR